MARSRMSLIREILTGVDDIGFDFMKAKHPISLGVGGGLGAFGMVAGLGAPIAGGLFDDLRGETERVAIEQVRSSSQENLRSRLRAMEDVRIQERNDKNLARIQQSSPHMFQQVMSGRVLPQGAIVLGGGVREDLLQELAAHMGSLQGQDSLSLLT